ncbi:MAG: hypothetical protein LBL82_06275 [Oscillospiraceae bacterium]|nr:hypothetical protein [Oscillospiraceae bacterium]
MPVTLIRRISVPAIPSVNTVGGNSDFDELVSDMYDFEEFDGYRFDGEQDSSSEPSFGFDDLLSEEFSEEDFSVPEFSEGLTGELSEEELTEELTELLSEQLEQLSEEEISLLDEIFNIELPLPNDDEEAYSSLDSEEADGGFSDGEDEYPMAEDYPYEENMSEEDEILSIFHIAEETPASYPYPIEGTNYDDATEPDRNTFYRLVECDTSADPLIATRFFDRDNGGGRYEVSSATAGGREVLVYNEDGKIRRVCGVIKKN